MQNIGVYLVVLVTGALIGASVMSYVTMNKNTTIIDQVKVIIQGIDYNRGDSVMKVEFFTNIPEKNLKGKVSVIQDEKQWTAVVNWHYTGFGEVDVLCNSIDETKSFRLIYNEKNSGATYLDRIIDWNEVSLGFQGS